MINRYLSMLLLVYSLSTSLCAQSFDDEKTAAANYLKRMYATSPFEGVKEIQGDGSEYYAVVITKEVKNQPEPQSLSVILREAQRLLEAGTTQPCIKIEMVETVSLHNKVSYLFICTTLKSFVKNSTLLRSASEISRIVNSPLCTYVVSSISLEKSKYANASIMYKVGSMKVKKNINTLINGSTIHSEFIINIDSSNTEFNSKISEKIKEYSYGWVPGVELLYESFEDSITYLIYYSKIKGKLK
jgi:hypothetical protein